jgi:hypothetical protein
MKRAKNVCQQNQITFNQPLVRLLSELVDQILISEAKNDFMTKCLIDVGKPMVPRLLKKLDNEPELVDRIKVKIRQALEEDDKWLGSKESIVNEATWKETDISKKGQTQRSVTI